MLERLRNSRTEQKRRAVRAAILLEPVAGLSDQAIARDHGVNRNTVILCIQKCLRFGVQAAWENCRVRANRVGFRMRQWLGFRTLPVGSLRSWAMPKSYGRTVC